MNIDRAEFRTWMDRIMDRFDIVTEHLKERKQQTNAVDGEILLDNGDLLQMLKVSLRTLQRYRSSGRLPYYSISGKLYYKHSDVHQFIRDSFNSSPRTRKKSGKR